MCIQNVPSETCAKVGIFFWLIQRGDVFLLVDTQIVIFTFLLQWHHAKCCSMHIWKWNVAAAFEWHLICDGSCWFMAWRWVANWNKRTGSRSTIPQHKKEALLAITKKVRNYIGEAPAIFWMRIQQLRIRINSLCFEWLLSLRIRTLKAY